MVLLDSMHPEQYTRMASWPGFYEMFRRMSAVSPSLARLGIGRLIYGGAYSELPAAQRDQERAFLSTPRHSRSVRDEFSKIRMAMGQAAKLHTLGRRSTRRSVPTHGSAPEPATRRSATQTFETQASDLHAVLDAAGEPAPYVVVGHSFGGAEAVTFTSQYPDDVVGLMLVDASPATWPTTVCSVPAYEELCAVMHDSTLDPERLDAIPAFADVAAIRSLGDLPMTVMSAAHRTDPALMQHELTRLDAVWAAGVRTWASLSPASTVVSVQDTGHHIQLDQPALVVEEIGKLLP